MSESPIAPSPVAPSKGARRFASAITLAVALSLLAAGCGLGAGGAANTPAAPDDTTKTTFSPNSTMGVIRSRGHLIVGVRWDVKPFAYIDPSTGAPSGFDVALVDQIATVIFGTNDIEGKITWVPLDPRVNDLALEQDKVDIVVGRYPISVAEKAFIDFAGPYFSSPQSIIVLGDTGSGNGPQTATDLNGQKVCIVTGSTNIDALKALVPNADTSDVRSTVTQCGADLLSNKVSGLAADYVDELPFINNASNVSQLGAQYGNAQYGIGLKKGTSDLRSFLNNQIQAFDYETAYQTWIDSHGNGGTLHQPNVDRY